MFGEVRRRTETAVREVEPLLEEREKFAEGTPEQAPNHQQSRPLLDAKPGLPVTTGVTGSLSRVVWWLHAASAPGSLRNPTRTSLERA